MLAVIFRLCFFVPNIGPSPNVNIPNNVVKKIIRKNWLIKAFSNEIFTLMTWFLF
jgi:hypothetical protein